MGSLTGQRPEYGFGFLELIVTRRFYSLPALSTKLFYTHKEIRAKTARSARPARFASYLGEPG